MEIDFLSDVRELVYNERNNCLVDIKKAEEQKITPGTIEIEIRFKNYFSNRNDDGIPYVHYKRLLNVLRKNRTDYVDNNDTDYDFVQDNYPATYLRNVKTTDYIYPTDERNIQYRKRVELIDKSESINVIRKIDKASVPVHNYRFTISISYEEPSSIPRFSTPSLIRVKDTESYVVDKQIDGGLQIDLSRIIQGHDETYEIELEVINAISFNYELLNIHIKKILNIIHETIIPFTTIEQKQVITDFNSLMGFDTIILNDKNGQAIQPNIDNRFMFQMRNLHINDLVYGGIIGGNETYTVTHKADGVRKFIYFHPSGIWLIYPPVSTHLISRERIYQLEGFVGEGELIPMKRRTKNDDGQYHILSKIWLMLYDCLAVPTQEVFPMDYRGKSIQKEKLLTRLISCKPLYKLFGSSDDNRSKLMTIKVKNFYQLGNTNKSFFHTMNEMERIRKEGLEYDDDGYIFTPNEMPYDSGNSRLPLPKRLLTNVADICKWKPPEQLTIDFSIMREKHWGNIITKLYSWSPKDRRLIPFTGSFLFKFNGNVSIDKDVSNGSIVEFRWDSNQMVAQRIRWDKNRPNNEEYAIDIWNMIQRPILIDILIGKGFGLMSEYHNRIKRKLFDSVSDKDKTLLDIGSGKGEDIFKMRNFRRIVFVEPNPLHVSELKRRAVLFFGQHDIEIITDDNYETSIVNALERNDNYIIIKTGGENYQLIERTVNDFIGRKVDVVSTMLSLSFFWINNLYRQLGETINRCLSPTGKLIFMSIDKDTVQEAYQPYLSRGPNLKQIFNPNEHGIVFEYDFDHNKLNIDIPGTIVKQEEYPTNIDEFRMLFPNLVVENMYTANGEQLLSFTESILSAFYTYGMLTPKKSEPLRSEMLIYEPPEDYDETLNNKENIDISKINPEFYNGFLLRNRIDLLIEKMFRYVKRWLKLEDNIKLFVDQWILNMIFDDPQIWYKSNVNDKILQLVKKISPIYDGYLLQEFVKNITNLIDTFIKYPKTIEVCYKSDNMITCGELQFNIEENTTDIIQLINNYLYHGGIIPPNRNQIIISSVIENISTEYFNELPVVHVINPLLLKNNKISPINPLIWNESFSSYQQINPDENHIMYLPNNIDIIEHMLKTLNETNINKPVIMVVPMIIDFPLLKESKYFRKIMILEPTQFMFKQYPTDNSFPRNEDRALILIFQP